MTFKDGLPQGAARSREVLFEFLVGHDRWLCELVDLGKWGVQAQFWRNEEFDYARRFDHSEHDHALARDLAIEWATSERRAMEEAKR